MRERGGGSIVNTGSMNSYIGFEGVSAYCAAKGGVLMLTKALDLSAKRKQPVKLPLDPDELAA